MKRGITLFILFFHVNLFAQIQSCIDPVISDTLHSQNVQNGVFYQQFRWPNGKTLTVKFLSGSEYLQNNIKTIVKAWEDCANIKFDFILSGTADIRIDFKAGAGSWSKIGTTANEVPANQATMNFGWFTNATPYDELKRTTLHEFGHALGLLHEHQNPTSPIQWNYQRAYAFYMQVQGWTKEMVDHQIFDRYSVTQSNNEFDKESIMIYPIPSELTIDGFSVGINNALSQKDKKLIGQLYPKPLPAIQTATTNVIQNHITELGTKAFFDIVSSKHNVFKQGKKGMIVQVNCHLENTKSDQVIIVAYIHANNNMHYSAQGQYDYNGKLAEWVRINTPYEDCSIKNVELFIPYEVISTVPGENKLKFEVEIIDKSGQSLLKSGKYQFTYQNGPTCDDFQYSDLSVTINEQLKRIYFAPRFILKYANGGNSKIWLYFYNSDGTPIKAKEGSSSQDDNGNLCTWGLLTPQYEETYYNSYGRTNYTIFLPYNELPLQFGSNTFKVRFVVKSNSGNEYNECKSEKIAFTLNRY